MTGSSVTHNTIIIGGGQAGLSVGYYLRRQGRDFVILDANERVGDSWRKRWDSLRLFTPAGFSGLAGIPFPGPRYSYPTKDAMADYLEAYAARFDLPVRTGVRVDRLLRRGDQFVLMAGDLQFGAENVVVAMANWQKPWVPLLARQLDPAIVQLHSSEYRNPSQLREGGVLIVGAGNSGAEIALELARTHQTWLSGRHPGSEPLPVGSFADWLTTPAVWILATHVLNVQTAVGRKLRPKMMKMTAPLARVRTTDLLVAGVERIHFRTAGTREGLPVLEDGTVIPASNVIWCTGFEPGFEWIALPVLGDDGLPVHERGVVATQPGLFFAGLFFQSALTSSTVGGVARDAEYIARQIAARERMPALRDRAHPIVPAPRRWLSVKVTRIRRLSQ